MSIKDRLSRFYTQLKQIQPTIADFKAGGHDDETAKSLFEMFNIDFKEEQKFTVVEGNLFESFFKTFEVKGFQVNNWWFLENYQEEGHQIKFAKCDVDEILMDKRSGEILFVDFYDAASIQPLAPSFKVFLEILLIEIEYDKIGYLELPFTDLMRKDYKEKITALVTMKE